MAEEWLMAHSGNEANQSRLRYLIDNPPKTELRALGSASTPRRTPRAGLTLAAAQQMLAGLDQEGEGG